MCYTSIVILVRKLIWDSWNNQHIARHDVFPEEVEAVCHGSPLVLRGQQKSRLVLVGPTEEKRMLTAVFEAKGKGTYYPITAYPTDAGTIALYNRLKGGEKNE